MTLKTKMRMFRVLKKNSKANLLKLRKLLELKNLQKLKRKMKVKSKVKRLMTRNPKKVKSQNRKNQMIPLSRS